jgi:L-alanine-DL-glutamate epimerase-like enolase superfamily enzyme
MEAIWLDDISLSRGLDEYLDLGILEISYAYVPFTRPRKAGCNARLGEHGKDGRAPILRIKIGDSYGFGWSYATHDEAKKFISSKVSDFFAADGLISDQFKPIEFAILDWIGNVTNKPVYEMVSMPGNIVEGEQFTVPVYDSSIYIDELHIEDDKKAVEFICEEIREGMARGHKNFKIKTGRPAMWMSYEEGMKRDVDIVIAVRNIIPADGKIMVDVNNGYNLNMTKEFLREVEDYNLHWIEEAFHEDEEYNTALKQWIKEQGMSVLVADGEGLASPEIKNWVKSGIIDVLQFDLRLYGFSNWIRLGKEIDEWGALSGPHNYGEFVANFAQAHISRAFKSYTMAEWDESKAEGIDSSGFLIKDGLLYVPKTPGFGLVMDHEMFNRFSEDNGWNAVDMHKNFL